MEAKQSTKRLLVFDEGLLEEVIRERFRQSAAFARWGNELVFDVTFGSDAPAGRTPLL